MTFTIEIECEDCSSTIYRLDGLDGFPIGVATEIKDEMQNHKCGE